MRSIIQYLTEGEKEIYKVPMINKTKDKRVNILSGRMKTYKHVNHLETTIPPEQRTFKNLPRYADKKPKVRFQDWFEIDSNGWSPNGKCYGYSHRAVHGFKIGDKITSDTGGNEGGKEFVLKTREQVEEMAKKFARSVS